jgi:hypothetical protein
VYLVLAYACSLRVEAGEQLIYPPTSRH